MALPASHSIPLLFSIEFCICLVHFFLTYTLAYEQSILGLRHDFHSFEISDEHPHTQSSHSLNLGFQKWQIEKKSPLLAIGKFNGSVNSFKLIVLCVIFIFFFVFVHYYLNYLQIVRHKN